MNPTTCFALTAIALVATSTAYANLVVNGSFEDPVVPANSYTNYLGGSTAITGWTVVGVETTVVDGGFTQNGITFQAQNGNQWADLTGASSSNGLNGVTQSISTTVGEPYVLSFYVGSATDGQIFFPSGVDLRIDDGFRVSYMNDDAPNNMLDWRQFTVPFVATSSSTIITFYNGSSRNNSLSALDNVVVDRAIPEPSSIALLAIGAAALAYARRRVA